MAVFVRDSSTRLTLQTKVVFSFFLIIYSTIIVLLFRRKFTFMIVGKNAIGKNAKCPKYHGDRWAGGGGGG